jgi:hypothetical protein
LLHLCDFLAGRSTPAHVEREFRRCLASGILLLGFARARSSGIGHDFLVAFIRRRLMRALARHGL